jgi:hypothetical protein
MVSVQFRISESVSTFFECSHRFPLTIAHSLDARKHAIILLIALMRDTTEKIKDDVKVVALRERAGMLLDMDMVLGKGRLRGFNFQPRWLHALIRASDLAPCAPDPRPTLFACSTATLYIFHARYSLFVDYADSFEYFVPSAETECFGKYKHMHPIKCSAAAILVECVKR